MSQSALPPEIRGLSVPDRVQLVEQIWDSIVEDEKSFQLTDAQKAELDRRLAHREGLDYTASTWDDVKKRLLDR